MKQVGNTILAKGVNHILAKRDNSAWPKGAKLSGFSSGRRDAITGARLKEEGATSGVSDLILLKSNRFYGGLCIEMKKPGGRQSPAQKEWQKDAEANGAKYVVCKSLDEFMKVTIDYLNDV